MAVRVEPVDAAAAVVVVDLAGPPVAGVGPVVEPASLDPAEDLVELVLAEVDERTYDPRGYSVPGGSPGMGRHHPIAWCQPYDGGRAIYTALGHKAESFEEPLLLSHLLGGIRMAAGVARFDCGAED